MKDINLYEKIPNLEKNFTVKFKLYESKSNLKPHWHEHIELMYLLAGECDFIVSGRTMPAKAGDLLVINSTEVHSFEAKKELRFFSVLLFPAFFADVDFDSMILHNLISGDEHIREIFHLMNSEANSNEPMSDMMLKSYTYQLMAYLGRNCENRGGKSQADSSAQLERLNTVLEYISANYTSGISTRNLASMCFLSEAHFCRFFKSAVGKSCTEYINRYRIEKATVLLSNTCEPVSVVASLVGFDDMNYFSRVFKQIKGISPVKYRKSFSEGINAGLEQ